MNDGQRGSAVLLTLFLSAVVITIGIGFNWIVKEHLKAAEGLKIKTEAMLNVHSAFDTVMYSILSGIKTQKEFLLSKDNNLLGVGSIPLNGSETVMPNGVRMSVMDSNGMVSLQYSGDPLKRLIASLSGEDAKGIIDSYADWIEPGAYARLNGAKESYYRLNGYPYTSRGYPIQYKEEFALIKGMNKQLYKKAEPYITLLPATGFNPNTASGTVLKAYLDINDDSLQRLQDYISRKPISSDPELFNLVGRTIVNEEGVFYYPSRYMEITVKAGFPETVYAISAGVDTRPSDTMPYNVMFWNEE